MAKELFLTHWLFTEQMQVAGENLIKKLDETNSQVVAAFWIYDAEEKFWKLTIVSPLVETEGPRNYYKRIDEINESAKADEEIVSLHDISVANTDNRIVRALKCSVLGNAKLENNRLGRNYLDGIYIEDMYLYRMDWDLLEKITSYNVALAA